MKRPFELEPTEDRYYSIWKSFERRNTLSDMRLPNFLNFLG